MAKKNPSPQTDAGRLAAQVMMLMKFRMPAEVLANTAMQTDQADMLRELAKLSTAEIMASLMLDPDAAAVIGDRRQDFHQYLNGILVQVRAVSNKQGKPIPEPQEVEL